MSTAKKVAWILLVVIGVAIVAILGVVAASAIRPGRPIGMQQIAVGAPGGQIPVIILYPTKAQASWTWLGLAAVKLAPNGPIDGQRRPLILISHGSGAASTSHLDTALALAEKGYVVAAPLHAGDNFRDQSKVGTNAWIDGRAVEMRRVLNHLLGNWSGRSSLDPGKIGIFGFSAGGTTALVNVGGKLDSARLSRHCLQRPECLHVPKASGAGQ